jgi:Trm5-related predicted tRNA methylase
MDVIVDDELLWLDETSDSSSDDRDKIVAKVPHARSKPRLSAVDREALNKEYDDAKKLRKRLHQRARAKQRGKVRVKLGVVPCHKPIIVVDISYAEMLPVKEQASVFSQGCVFCVTHVLHVFTHAHVLVSQLYGYNRRSGHALDLHLVGTECPSAVNHLTAYDGFSYWQIELHPSPSLLDAFPGRERDIVVLSPDSPNLIERFDEDKIYVLGGIADNHGDKKHATLEHASALGVAHARLPLVENFPAITLRGCVLNLNHCFEVVHGVVVGLSWYEAIDRAIPTRSSFRKAIVDE